MYKDLVGKQFLHLRLTSNEWSYEPDHKGGVTIAYEVIGNQINAGLAITHRRDNYSRKDGRKYAGGRLDAKSGVIEIKRETKHRGERGEVLPSTFESKMEGSEDMFLGITLSGLNPQVLSKFTIEKMIAEAFFARYPRIEQYVERYL